ncbi:MAG: zinc-binding alcohol dehydrogenase [Acidobacteria bacterium]|nr:MAG: zinc-binding alcohol dehydrogenase [Acidobacteriota bacterium]
MSKGRIVRQFWITAPGRAEIVQAELPPQQTDDVLVRTVYSAISRGTESLVLAGEVPPSQYEAMRAPFQEGEFPAPVKYGYTSVGRVEKGPDAPPHELTGRLVFCLYPHQDLYLVPAAAVTPIPDAVPAGRAVLAANMETAVNVLWDARPSTGDRIVVIGGGVIGMLVAWLCRQIPGARVTVVDPNPMREPIAGELGVAFRTEPPRDENVDLVVHASGQPEGLTSALTIAGMEGTIVDASWYGIRRVTLPLGEAFHSRRLTLKSSQVGRVPADRSSRWDRGRRMALALDLLTDCRLDALITGESAFDDLPAVLAAVSRSPGATLCHRIRYSTA